jgi:TPR repeat protein
MTAFDPKRAFPEAPGGAIPISTTSLLFVIRPAVAVTVFMIAFGTAASDPIPPREISFNEVRAMESAGDMKNAVRFYASLARGGNGQAMLRVGELYEYGTADGRLQANKEEAMNWYLKARNSIHLPPRIAQSLDTWLQQQYQREAQKSPEQRLLEAEAVRMKAQKEYEARLADQGRDDPQARRAAFVCRLYTDRWDVACWAKDGSYLYKSNEECMKAANNMYTVCSLP